MQRLFRILVIATLPVACGCMAPAVRIEAQTDSLRPLRIITKEKEEASILVARAEPLAPTPAVTPLEPARIALSDVANELAQDVVGQPSAFQRSKSIRDISLDISPPLLITDQNKAIDLPQNFAANALPALAQEQPFTRGDLAATGYEWHPSPEGLTFCYQPLYFEEVNLERYGRSWGCLQPFVSAAHFYSSIPALPYMVFARPARRCTDHPHWTLPGYKIPQREPEPLVPSLTGAAAEVAVIYGIVLLIP